MQSLALNVPNFSQRQKKQADDEKQKETERDRTSNNVHNIHFPVNIYCFKHFLHKFIMSRNLYANRV